MRRTSLPLLLVLLTAGCIVRTNLESMVRPDWERSAFDRIVVLYSSSDLQARKQVENRFARKAAAFVPSYELFFPGQDYSNEEIAEIMEENDLEAALIISPQGAATSTKVLPGTTTTSCSGNTCTSFGGPFVATFPQADFSAVVVDWKSAQQVWTASVESKGNAFTDYGNIRGSLVEAVIERLREDGLIAAARR